MLRSIVYFTRVLPVNLSFLVFLLDYHQGGYSALSAIFDTRNSGLRFILFGIRMNILLSSLIFALTVQAQPLFSQGDLFTIFLTTGFVHPTPFKSSNPLIGLSKIAFSKPFTPEIASTALVSTSNACAPAKSSSSTPATASTKRVLVQRGRWSLS